MDLKTACEILELEYSPPWAQNMETVKRQYKTMALLYHPDKNQTDTTKKFQEIREAYDYFTEYLQGSDDECDDDDKGSEQSSYEWFFYSLLSDYATKIDRQILYKITMQILQNCEEKAVELLSKIDKKILLVIYNFIRKNSRILRIGDSFMKQLADMIAFKQQNDECIILQPSIADLFSNNLYRLHVHGCVYVVPLWHHELVYDNSGNDVYVKCEPILPENVVIDEYNNIIVSVELWMDDIWDKENYAIDIDGVYIEIPIKRLRLETRQSLVLYGCGISKINTADIYDIQKRGNIRLNIEIKYTQKTTTI